MCGKYTVLLQMEMLLKEQYILFYDKHKIKAKQAKPASVIRAGGSPWLDQEESVFEFLHSMEVNIIYNNKIIMIPHRVADGLLALEAPWQILLFLTWWDAFLAQKGRRGLALLFSSHPSTVIPFFPFQSRKWKEEQWRQVNKWEWCSSPSVSCLRGDHLIWTHGWTDPQYQFSAIKK